MKKKNTSNSCVRQCRDELQIKSCQTELKKMERPFDDLASFFSLTSNAVRIKILFLIKKEGRLCVCDLSEILEMTIPAISQHLKKLRNGGLIDTEREGTTIYNFVAKEAVSRIDEIFKMMPQTANA